MSTCWTREEILRALRDMLYTIRQVQPDRVIDDAKLFADLGLEIQDIAEMSFHFEERFDFPYPFDELAHLLAIAGGYEGRTFTLRELNRALRQLFNALHLHADIDTLAGRDPRDDIQLYRAVENLLTVGALCAFVTDALRAQGHTVDLLPNNLMPAKRHLRLQAIFENFEIALLFLQFPQTAFARI